MWEEVKLIQPTSFSAVPAVWADYRAYYQERLAEIDAEEIEDEKERKQRVVNLREEFRCNLSERVRTISIGGALVPRSLMKWINLVFWSSMVLDSYGTTEVHSTSLGHEMVDKVQMKLIDWGVCSTQLSLSACRIIY